MKKVNQYLLMAWIGLASLTACKHAETEIKPGTTTELPSAYTEVGQPKGAVVSKTIGPNGGTIATTDGRVQLVLPAGALDKETTISIQPITSHTPNGLNLAYRFSPDGTQFKKPATLTFQYNAAGVTINDPDAFGVAYQRSNRAWYAVDGVRVDTEKRQITAPMKHFSDWSPFEEAQLDSLTIDNGARNFDGLVDYGESINLYVRQMRRGTTDESGEAMLELDNSRQQQWKLAGDGKLESNGWMATYTAPKTEPKRNPVTVSVQVNFVGKNKNVTLARDIYVGAGYLKVTFKGQTRVYTGLTLNDDTTPWQISGGETEDDYVYIHLNTHQPGEYSFGEWGSRKASDSFIKYQYGDKIYASDKGWCMSKGNYAFPAKGKVTLTEYVRGKVARGTFEGNLVDMDVEDCINSGPGISGEFFVRGTKK
ncbi:hypothetical protein GCM10023189_19090 [Nibrella saemangeumensis]|uniref:ZU5 domain-containing protein n=1 Tax=Nibrella saemangeumensis TaxID=1084526 RepID=A0ABP8MSE7_9BACT